MKTLFLATLLASFVLATVGGEAATTNKILRSFKNAAPIGGQPYGRLLLDGPNVAYGTTSSGGAKGGGVVFKLTRPASGVGTWGATVLTSFGYSDGGQPAGDLVKGPDGTLYGATIGGGAYTYGTVYKLVPPSGTVKQWRRTILHEFAGGTDGGIVHTSLILDADGILYGTTREGGTWACGTVFRLKPPARPTGRWAEQILHRFRCGTDGAYPSQGVILLPGGQLIGTTTEGGAYDYGTIFTLTPPASGTGAWAKATVHMFGNGTDGRKPFSSLERAPGGTLYGTTLTGGAKGFGTVFALIPGGSGQGAWTPRVIYHFKGGSDGEAPVGGVIRGPDGTLYGTTMNGGGYGFGTVYQLKPPTAGNPGWVENVLLPFTPGGSGTSPEAGLVRDDTGTLYGTTMSGGAHGHGTAFSVTP